MESSSEQEPDAGQAEAQPVADQVAIPVQPFALEPVHLQAGRLILNANALGKLTMMACMAQQDREINYATRLKKVADIFWRDHLDLTYGARKVYPHVAMKATSHSCIAVP